MIFFAAPCYSQRPHSRDSVIDWSGKIFNDESFTNHSFDQRVSFRYATFDSTMDAPFTYTFFYKSADFTGASFKESMFYGTVFMDKASFSRTKFEKLYFDISIFENSADFSRLRNPAFELSFNHTYFKDTVDFSYNPAIKNEIDLTHLSFPEDDSAYNVRKETFSDIISNYFMPRGADAVYNPIRHINLYNTDISKIKLDYSRFNLYFKDIEAITDTNIVKNTLRLTTETGSLNRDKKISIYESLLKNFKDRGQLESYKKLDIEYHYFKADNSLFGAYVPDWWNRFGYEKERIFVHVVIFVILFTICTYFVLPFLQHCIYPLKAISEKEASIDHSSYYNRKRRKTLLNYGLSHLWYAFIYTATLFFGFALKIENIKFDSGLTKIVGTLYVLLVYTIGIICIAYMANFVIQR